MKKIISIALVLMAASSLIGCNTTKGFGQDLQQGGQAIQKAANDGKSDHRTTNAKSDHRTTTHKTTTTTTTRQS